MKGIFAAIFLTGFASAKENEVKNEKTDYIRIHKLEAATQLQTANTTFIKDEVTVTLIGAVHIADQKYYEALNKEFEKFPVVLFEMIGGENLAAILAAQKKRDNPHPLNIIMNKAADFLELAHQNHAIDYTAKNFVHADLTWKEYQELQQKRNESLLTFAFASSFGPQPKNEPNAVRLFKGLLTKNENLLKRELMIALAEGDEQIGGLEKENVVITDRNRKCLSVLQKQIDQGQKNCAIFYGAAHFPDLERSLLKLGYQKQKQEWLTAWDVPRG